MPARVHALIVARPDGRIPAALHLKRTLAALQAQTRRADSVTIVLCGEDQRLREIAAASGAEGVISASAATTFARAVGLASLRVDPEASIWLLAQDTAPEPEALARLVGALELSPSVGIAAPKLVRWDDREEIVSLGVTMTRFGDAVGLADGQLDQGQHDADDDVLGSDVRGLLLRPTARDRIAPDPALAGADEGLDMGVRARLGGWRVSLVPDARIAVAGDGVAAPPSGHDRRSARRRAYAERTAHLHRRLTYAPPVAVPVHWLLILPVALWRAAVHLVAKRPSLIGPEWAAAFVALTRWGSIARSRGILHAGRTAGWARIAPLRAGRAQLRHRFDVDDGVDAAVGPPREDLHFFSGGAAWAVLAALLVSVVAFFRVLGWPVLGGGGILPLSDTVGRLWTEASFGVRSTGIDSVGPADPFAGVLAVLGTLWPGSPSFALVLLWVLALPLAVLGGWFAATRLTGRAPLRLTAAAAWALAPTFLEALVQGRPAAVLVHLLLPWLFFAGSVAHRSWGAAGAASLLLALVVACAPVLVPALLVIWVAALVLVIVMRRGRGITHVLWTIVPAAVVFAPLVWARLRVGDALALLADPGLPWIGPQVAADAAGRAMLATGFPTADPSGWGALLGPDAPVWWVPLLVAPLALLALVAPITPRWSTGIVLLGVAALGVATAFAAVAISVGFAQSVSVPLWPGTGLSLAWVGVVGAAVVTLDAGLASRPRFVRPALAALAVAGIVAVAIAPLTAMARDVTLLTNGPASTLPAFVEAAGRDDAAVATLVLTPQDAGGISARVVWGPSETLDGQATVLTTKSELTAQDTAVAELVADLVASSSVDTPDELAALGVTFVLLAPAPEPESEAARALRLEAVTSIDQRAGLVRVGVTVKGELWRLTEPAAEPAPLTRGQVDTARWIALSQLAAIGIALLLAVPTLQSRRAARYAPRIVGQTGREPL